jgi:hypothetical protein
VKGLGGEQRVKDKIKLYKSRKAIHPLCLFLFPHFISKQIKERKRKRETLCELVLERKPVM